MHMVHTCRSVVRKQSALTDRKFGTRGLTWFCKSTKSCD